jgi:hypothetical protein
MRHSTVWGINTINTVPTKLYTNETKHFKGSKFHPHCPYTKLSSQKVQSKLRGVNSSNNVHSKLLSQIGLQYETFSDTTSTITRVLSITSTSLTTAGVFLSC